MGAFLSPRIPQLGNETVAWIYPKYGFGKGLEDWLFPYPPGAPGL